MRIRTVHRVAAALLIKVFLLDICYPTLAFALTGGPSQPEFESFEPVSTDQMVDLFTGDFNYNIPLMTVPGPNGGYPINLAYHAGIGMEQEASWVGLGWNINAGEISRQMRGLPDDFDGDQDAVTRTLKMKDNVTVTVGMEVPVVRAELLGARVHPLSAGGAVYYNSYRGVGCRRSISADLALRTNPHDAAGSAMSELGVEARIGYNSDSQTGLGLSTSLSFSGMIHNCSRSVASSSNWSVNADWTSRGGWDNIKTSASSRLNLKGHNLTAGSVGTDFSRPSSTPAPFAKTKGYDLHGSFSYGTSNGPIYLPDYAVYGSVSTQKVTEEKRTLPAYGFLYSQDRTGTETGLMDLSRENYVPLTKYIHNAPIPSFTYDAFSIKGQGIGGTFRPYRSGMGLVYDEALRTDAESHDAGVEVGQGSSTHIGVDLSDGVTSSYSGPWTSGAEALTTNSGTDLNYRGGLSDHPLYEPVYFKSTAEVTATPLHQWSAIGDEDPTYFHIGRSNNGGRRNAAFSSNLQINGHTPSQDLNAPRERRSQLITYRTNGQIIQDPAFANHPKFLYTTDEDVLAPNSGTYIRYDQAPQKHIGEITVTNTDGSRYIYGLAAYNKTQKEVVAAWPRQLAHERGDQYPGRVGLGTEADPAVMNTQLPGETQDGFYSSTELSPYAHTHLLTAIYSADYVDLKNDGPTDDDLGYYVKFNYTKTSGEFQWRMPYKGYHYQKGDYSNDNDDRVAYSYGTKEIYYLHSIETKTHIAYFRLNDENAEPRKDAQAASNEDDFIPDPDRVSSRFLKRIDLYSKDLSTRVLKSVELEYDAGYPLCRGVENGTLGKLTLKRVWFKDLGSDRGALSPYVFDYGDLNNANTNPNYNYQNVDRWGYYKPDPNTGYYTNSEHPYVDQRANAADRNAWASAWCLRKITLPSGGAINVEYEADDYAYVQDRPATQMCQILDTGHLEDDPRTPIKKGDLRIYFQMNSADDDPHDYVDDLDRVYFKVWVDLKKRSDLNIPALDYVEGYARVDHSGEIGKTGDKGYFSVLAESYGYGNFPVHPFRKAAWQYMRYKRPDLFQTVAIGHGASAGASVMGVLNYLYNPTSEISPLNLLTGYYTMANARGYASHIQLHDGSTLLGNVIGKPSFVRLLDKSDMKKYGGGHRVSSIVVKDNWTDSFSRSYGKRYTYDCIGEKDVDHDGTIKHDGVEDNFHYSSGVAAYEPIIGGEENALHRPVYYDAADQELSFKNEQLYLEEPFNESYYPAPVVGYSRVVVTDFTPDLYGQPANRTGNGVTVHEFYTAKDFPVRSNGRTGLEPTTYSKWIPIPLCGSSAYYNNGYSQGYAIELNDMHGQVKSIAKYRNTDDIRGTPVRKTTYYYHTDPSDPKRLNNQVDVLTGDMSIQKAYLGQSVECFTDMDEHGTTTDTEGKEYNLTVLGFFPMLLPIPVHDHIESLYRALVTNKIIEKHGILERVVVEDEGAVTEQRNLAYDAATGAPLLTSVSNSFDDPVYTYAYAGHNIYPGMDAAYTNTGANFPTTNIVNGLASVTNADHYFYPGDEVEVWNANCSPNICAVLYVQSVSSGQVHFEVANGTAPTLSGELHIRRSGHRNLLTATCGKIVSLNNPVAQTNLAWIDLFNQYIAGNPAIPPAATFLNIPIATTNCSTGANYVMQGSAVVQPGNTHLTIGFDGFPCDFQLLIPSIAGAPPLINSMSDIHIDGYNGASSVPSSSYGIADVWPQVLITIGGVQYQTWCRSEDLSGCLQPCLRTLHADALRMRDDWTYDYADVGDPVGESGPLASHAGNDYRYGRKGIWRPWSNYLYQVDRLKGDADRTNIEKDGEYATFQLFNFNDPASGDPHWHQRDEMLRYSPYGFALESKDAVGNHSAQLYGYDNSQVTASAVNANYFEIAADGFEDHPGNYSPGHGHLALNMPGGATLGAPGHTGKKCLYVQEGAALLNATVDDPAPTTWSPMQGQRYTVSAWFYGADHPRIRLFNAQSNATIAPAMVHNDGLVLDGWRKVDVEFIAPSAGAHLGIAFEDEQNGPFWIDDIRLHPTDATMSTFVYDRGLFWLNATLDDRNYATFYNYDEEGVLTQVKKETERGIQTLRTTRQNVEQ